MSRRARRAQSVASKRGHRPLLDKDRLRRDVCRLPGLNARRGYRSSHRLRRRPSASSSSCMARSPSRRLHLDQPAQAPDSAPSGRFHPAQAAPRASRRRPPASLARYRQSRLHAAGTNRLPAPSRPHGVSDRGTTRPVPADRRSASRARSCAPYQASWPYSRTTTRLPQFRLVHDALTDIRPARTAVGFSATYEAQASSTQALRPRPRRTAACSPAGACAGDVVRRGRARGAARRRRGSRARPRA